jgi:eukaryotic-like serine/threonine-protein kinase
MASPAVSPHIIRFGEFELNCRTRELRSNGQIVSLQEQPFQILLALVERPGELVSRNELKGKLWPSGTFVDFDSSLNTAINRLRGFLADSAEHPRFIESLPRRGYRFVASVTQDGLSEGAPFAGHESRSHYKWAVAKAAAVAVAAVVAIVSASIRVNHSGQPRAKYPVVIADFGNTTGDPIFDGTLRQGLAAQLEQTPFLATVSDEQIAQTLRLMGVPPESKLTVPVVNQICRRNGSSVWVGGSIARFESQYVVGLRALTCQNNQTLAEIQVTAANRNGVLSALSTAATQLRTQLGESLSTIKKFDTPLDQATTPSIEALQAYTLGRKALWKRDDAQAVLFFQRAIGLDSNFALAYAALGMSYMNLGETVLAAENTKKAYELRRQVSGREQFYIESHYFHIVLGDLEKARRVYELWEETFPDDIVPAANLGDIYTQLGRYERVLTEDLRVSAVDPSNASNYADRVADYIYLNRLQDAAATAEAAISKGFDSPKLHPLLYVLAFLQNDASGMAKQVSWGAGKPGVEDVFLALEAETAAHSGHLEIARTLCSRAALSAQNAGNKETAARYEVLSALRSSLAGQRTQTRERVANALKLSNGRDVQAAAALALAFVGETERSQKLTNDLAKRFPDDTVVQFNYLPTIRGQVALNNASPEGAIAATEPAALYELGDQGVISVAQGMYPIYVRGEAYIAAGEGNKAVIEFTKLLNHPGVIQNRMIGSIAQLGLARAHKFAGNNERARASYLQFLTLWKDADPDIPILKQAKAEYAKLE